MVTDGAVTQHNSLAFQKGYPNMTAVNAKILELREKGVLRELDQKWFKAQCLTASIRPQAIDDIVLKSYYKLDLSTFSGALLLLVAGLAVGALITLVEICIFRWAESVSV